LLACLVLAVALPGAARGAEPASPDGTTALQQAVYAGDVAAVRRLLHDGADPRATNLFGATPMMLAATRGDTEVIRALLEAGVDADSANEEGQTALMAVARTGNVAAAQLLIRHGAQVRAHENWGGQTALMWAAAQSQPQMIRLLLQHGARVDERSAVRDWQRRVTAEGRPKDMFRGGLTPLLFAAREGCIDCLRELLARHADIDLPDPDGTTALVMALLNYHWDAAQFLIEAGADVNLWDIYGQTPLYVAVDMNTPPVGRRVELPTMDAATGQQVAQLLLERGANPNAQLKLRPRYRNIPNDRYRDPTLVWGTTPLLRAAKAGDAPMVKLLLEHGALADLANSQGVTPLMAAAGEGMIHEPTRGRERTEDDALACYALLRAAGADVNARTVLSIADADLKVTTAANRTALHAAAANGWNRLVRRLVEDGAELDVIDSNGLSPIDYALGRFPKEFNALLPEKHTDTVALLRSLGAKAENPAASFPPGTTPKIQAIVP
ncbi:MAG TPA: ankyrin repeat domain-containing protein, partial [Steroidobacteraceae bacterium]|nr:ankyrin repeat domain-containing protein [Steroidobacteraceae bacterium]